MALLEIKNLHVQVEDESGTVRPILRGLNLEIEKGEVSAIMGPNGSGKSTLAHVLAGKDGYTITEGSITYDGEDLLALDPEERARAGVFLAFQYPVEIPGVNNQYFLKAAINAKRKHEGLDELDAYDFLKLIKSKMELLEMDAAFKGRAVNVGFSGGEKKRNEILQMTMLDPKFAVLDETDSGLDIDALRIVAKGVNSLRDENRGMLVVTHYQRLLDYIVPDKIHVLVNGRVVKSGDKSLALELEKSGYAEIEAEAA